MADNFGSGQELVRIDDNEDLKIKHIKISINEKTSQIKQITLNRDNLTIEADKMALNIDILNKELTLFNIELNKLEPIDV